ncbi:MAG: hypothetical protein B7733_06360 [Myxococcales bacterium FL481]|nr:MAG: hypothetical protein B7733_06360 [Myxococcales bacterium FL481]
MTEIPVPTPRGGISDTYERSNQTPDTTQRELNMRHRDPITGRVMWSQRAGHRKYTEGRPENQQGDPVAQAVRNMAVIVRENDTIDWENLDGIFNDQPDLVWSQSLKHGGWCRVIATDAACNIYAMQGKATLVKYNPDGKQLGRFTFPVSDEDHIVRALAIDDNSDPPFRIYAGVSEGVPGDSANSHIWAIDQTAEGDFEMRWRIGYTGEPLNHYVEKLIVSNRLLYVLRNSVGQPGGNVSYLSVHFTLDSTVLDRKIDDFRLWEKETDGNALNWPQNDMALNSEGDIFTCRDPGTNGDDGRIEKHRGSDGEEVYAIQPTEGAGWAIAVNSEDDVYSLGATQLGSPPNPPLGWMLKKFQDTGSSLTQEWERQSGAATAQNYFSQRIDVDRFDNVYLPENDSNGSAFRGYATDGALIVFWTSPNITQDGLAVKVDEDYPRYSKAYEEVPATPTSEDYPRALHLYVGQDRPTNQDTLSKVKLVRANALGTALPPRQFDVVQAQGQSIWIQRGEQWELPLNGSGRINGDTEFVDMAYLFGQLVIVDGFSSYVYDVQPTPAFPNGRVQVYESQTTCQPPRMPQFATAYRGRMVLSRLRDDPYNWHASAVNDIFDYNEFPAVATVTQSVSGSFPDGPGQPEDIIQSCFAIGEDFLMFGGDRSLSRITGDPAEAARIDVISREIGTTFGPAWAMAPDGMVFFSGQPRGIYAMPYNGRPESISAGERFVDRRLDRVDLSTHYFHLVWDEMQYGLHVFQVPYAKFGTKVYTKHWFWDRKLNRWSEDDRSKDDSTSPGSFNTNPHCAAVYNADSPTDRMLLVGCADGFIRYVDPDAKSDDVAPINAEGVIGPLGSGANPERVDMALLQAQLDEKKDGCTYKLHAGPVPNVLQATKTESGEFQAGFNPKGSARANGDYSFIELRNAALGQSFGVEWLTVDVRPGGERRG